MTPADARRALWLVAGISSLLGLPWLVVRFPVGQDLPAHVETAWQLAALWRGDPLVGESLVAHAPPWPNSWPTAVLAAIEWASSGSIDGLDAARVMMAVGVACWPVSLAVLLHTLGRSPLLALVALPTAYDLAVSYGFLHFVVGKPLWALGLAAVVAALEQPSRLRVGLVALAVVVLFHSHLLLWASFLPLAGLVTLVVFAHRRATGAVVGALGVSCLPGLWWMTSRPPSTGRFVTRSIDDALARLWENLGDLAPGRADALGYVSTIVLVVVLAGVSGAARRRDETSSAAIDGRRRRFLLAILGSATSLFSLVGPIRTPQASIVAERFTSMGGALLLLWIVSEVATIDVRARRFVVVVGGIVIAMVLVVPTTQRFVSFQQAMGDFDALVDAVPEGAHIATLFSDPRTEHGHTNVLWHWPKLVARRRAVTDDSFAWRDTCVVSLAPGATPLRPPRRRGDAITAASLRGFDHLLVQGEDRHVEAALARGDVIVAFHTGVWRLLRVKAEPR